MEPMNISKNAARAAIIATLAISPPSAFAVEGLQISANCPDIVLSWPSAQGQSFLVEFRPDLNPGTAWTTLTNYLLAAPANSHSTFVHSNQVPCNSGGTNGFSGGGGFTPMAICFQFVPSLTARHGTDPVPPALR